MNPLAFNIFSSFFAISLLSGCVSSGSMIPGKLTAKNGKVLSFEIEKASRSGSVKARNNETGEEFSGIYVGLMETISGSNSIFAQGPISSAYGVGNMSLGSNLAKASANLVGDKGTTITCNMQIEAAFNPHGIGDCQDNKNMTYQLLF